MRRFAPALLLTACAGMPGCGGDRESASSGGESTSVQVEIVDLAGLERAVAAHAGRPLILNFWAMW